MQSIGPVNNVCRLKGHIKYTLLLLALLLIVVLLIVVVVVVEIVGGGVVVFLRLDISVRRAIYTFFIFLVFKIKYFYFLLSI